MLASRYSGTMLVTCSGKSCKTAIATAKSMHEYQDAYRVDKNAQAVDVIINVVANSEDRLIQLKDEILKVSGVKGIELKIGHS